MLPNTPQAVISFYAVLMAGGIVVQTNPLYTERELAIPNEGFWCEDYHHTRYIIPESLKG